MARPPAADPEQLLQPTFAARHVSAALKHFQAMTTEFQQSAWEEAIGKGGKFVEAALKALHVYAGKTLPPARQFKAGKVMDELEKIPAADLDDSIRLTIPRACRFVYDIATTVGCATTPPRLTRTRWTPAPWWPRRLGSWPRCSATRRR